jgi:hypothetical protein
MLVRCVDQHRIASVAAPHDEHVVVHGSDHDPVHLNVGVPPVEGAIRRHDVSIAPPVGGA